MKRENCDEFEVGFIYPAEDSSAALKLHLCYPALVRNISWRFFLASNKMMYNISIPVTVERKNTNTG